MNKVILTAITAGIVAVSGSGKALAQDEAQQEPPMRVVEGWTCSYRDGKGPDDLAKVNKAWNKWMDETGQTEYTAAVITPSFFGEYNFDFGWLGVAKTGDAFGKGTDLWVTEGGEVGAMFGEVITCESHTAWVSMVINTPEDDDGDEGDDDFVLSFSNCSIKEGHTFDEYIAASKEWDMYSKEVGIEGVGWVWFPVAGEANNDYGFKLVIAIDDYTQMGANWQKFMDGHWRKSSELFDDVADCDIPRIYNGKMIRRWAE